MRWAADGIMRPSVSDDVLCVQKESMSLGRQCVYLLLFQPVSPLCERVEIQIQPGTALQKAKACGGRSLRPDDITNTREFNYFSSVRKALALHRGLGTSLPVL